MHLGSRSQRSQPTVTGPSLWACSEAAHPGGSWAWGGAAQHAAPESREQARRAGARPPLRETRLPPNSTPNLPTAPGWGVRPQHLSFGRILKTQTVTPTRGGPYASLDTWLLPYPTQGAQEAPRQPTGQQHWGHHGQEWEARARAGRWGHHTRAAPRAFPGERLSSLQFVLLGPSFSPLKLKSAENLLMAGRRSNVRTTTKCCVCSKNSINYT